MSKWEAHSPGTQSGSNFCPCILLLQKRDPVVLWLIPSLSQRRMVILRVVKKRGWFLTGQHPAHAILPPTQTFLHHSKPGTVKACKLQEWVFCVFLSAHCNACGFPSIFSLKSIINIKHRNILESFPETKLQKIISKKDVKVFGRTDTGMSSDVVL